MYMQDLLANPKKKDSNCRSTIDSIYSSELTSARKRYKPSPSSSIDLFILRDTFLPASSYGIRDPGNELSCDYCHASETYLLPELFTPCDCMF